MECAEDAAGGAEDETTKFKLEIYFFWRAEKCLEAMDKVPRPADAAEAAEVAGAVEVAEVAAGEEWAVLAQDSEAFACVRSADTGLSITEASRAIRQCARSAALH